VQRRRAEWRRRRPPLSKVTRSGRGRTRSCAPAQVCYASRCCRALR
jgi:hypothetical protein